MYGGKGRAQLTPGEQQELNVTVDQRLDAWFEGLIEEQVPQIRAEIERQIIYSEGIAGLLATLSADPRSLALSLRAVVPLDDED